MPRLAKKQQSDTGKGPFRLARPCMALFRSLEYGFFRGGPRIISDRLRLPRDRMKRGIDA
jgi:hypothetical protein